MLVLTPSLLLVISDCGIPAANVHIPNHYSELPRPAIVAANILLVTLLSAVMVVAIAIWLIWFRYTLGMSQLRTDWIVLTCALAVSQLVARVTSYLTLGFGHTTAFSLGETFRSVTVFIVVISVAALSSISLNITIALAAFVTANLVVCAWSAWWILRDVPKPDSEAKPTLLSHMVPHTLSAMKELIRFGIRTIPNNLVWTLLQRIDRFIMVNMLDPAAVGVYAVASSLAEAYRVFPDSIGLIIFGPLSGMTKDRRSKTLALATRAAFWLMAGPIVLSMLVASPLVRVVYSEQYSQAVLPFNILLLGTLALGHASITGYAFVSAGRPEFLGMINLGSLLINVLANLALIPHFGVSGAAWASVAAYLFSAIVTMILIVRRWGVSWQSYLVPTNKDFNRLMSFAGVNHRLRRPTDVS